MSFYCEETDCVFVSNDSLLFSQHMLQHSNFCFVCNSTVGGIKNWGRHMKSKQHLFSLSKLAQEKGTYLYLAYMDSY
jgi:hypothetical protein